MIISIDAEKSFGKIQHPFMIKKKTLQKMSIEQNNKGLYDNPQNNKGLYDNPH